ncbi:MAG: hypothetical protein FJ272_15345, partial [Planctomycetes bacterium]|nr:hypothetical protein [Planctomycetota bacterium]
MNRAGFWPCLVVMGMLGAQGSAGVGEGVPPWWDGKWGCRLAVKVEPSPTPRRDFEVAARLQFAKLSWMLGEASVADTDSIQVVEWVDGHRWGAPVTREVVVEDGYHALAPRTPTESSGCVSVRWRVQGETAAGVTRRYYVYWRSLTEPFPIAEIPRSAVAEVKQAGVELGLAERAPEPALLKSFGRMKAHLAAASGDAGKDRARPFAMEALLPTHAFPESPAQLSAHIHAEPLAQDVSSLRLAVQLEPHAGRPLARAVVAPLTEPPWQLTASLPRLQPGSYRLRCELLRANGQRLASFLEFFRVVGAPKTAGQFALTLTEPAQAGREADVAQAGVPFPEGALRDPANVRLLDGKKESPSQWDTLATWKDGSVKWLFLTFPATLKAGESKRFTVEYGPKTHRMPTTGVSVQERADGVTVDTGRLRFTVGRRPFCLLHDVAVDADHDGRYEPMPLEPSGQVFVVHESGTVYDAALGDAEVHVLERGPVRVALHVKGWHAANDGTRFCQFDLRLYAYAGKSHLRLLHTFIFTGEPEKDRIRSVGIRLRPARGSGAQVRFGGEFQTESFPCSAAPTLVQDDWNHFALTADGQAAREGQQAAGWIDLSDSRVGLQLGVRDFFQQFPKGLAAEAGSVTAYLWPPGKPMDLSFDPKGEEYPVD